MEFETEYLGNSDMFTQFLSQDESFSLFEEEQKPDNVLVEKLTDYGASVNFCSDTELEDVDSLFDKEWMTSKINFEQLDSNFNFVGVNDIQPSIATLDTVDTTTPTPPILTLFGDRPLDIEKVDAADASSVSIDEPVSDDSDPSSPEQHVPDADTNVTFQALLEAYLAAAKTSTQEDSLLEDSSENDVFIVESPKTQKPSKRKLPDSTPEGPKAKVIKTPEQKERKRMQNRNAATRYRSKKRSEQDILNAKCIELEGENKELQKKVESKKQEVQYLKNLIIDVFSKKHVKI